MDYRAALQAAIAAAKDAGEILRREFHRAGGPRGTANHAEVDEIAEQRIRERLLAAESWGYLGEETGSVSGDAGHVWLVDPNDGTSSFMKGRRGSAVSIAALRDGHPVLGVVYAFGYPDDGGDLIAWAEGCGPVTRNGKPVAFRLDGAKLGRGSVVLLSQDAGKNAGANALCCRPARFMSIPSIAYRLALAAVGEGVAAVSLNGPGGWDYAAGHALVLAAGGTLVDESGTAVLYDRSGRSYTHCCFGGAVDAVKELAARSWDRVFDRSGKGSAPIFGLVRPVSGRTIQDSRLLSRAQGCLLGQFAGDALGSRVEFQSAASIRSRFPDGVRELEDGGTFNTIAGQPTDDSEMALMLARSIVREQRYDAGAVLEAYLYWLDSDPFDCGVTIQNSLACASAGTSREERLKLASQSTQQKKQSNGSLMRVSPLAVFGWTDSGRAVRHAREDSGLTHPNPVCRESCAAFVRAIVAALNGSDGPECYRAALEEARVGGEAAVISALEQAAAHPPEEMEGSKAGWVLRALQNAFYRLLHSASFEEALVETVGCGGDTDTNAAICGALLGAVYGRDAIPARWRRSVLTCRPVVETGAARPRPSDFWPVDACELAEALLLAGAEANRDASTPP